MDNFSDNYDNYDNLIYGNYSRNIKHINRTNTFIIADKRAGSRMAASKYSRVKNFYKISKYRKYDRDMKYNESDN